MRNVSHGTPADVLTLLTILGLLDEPTSGEYRLAGVPVTEIEENADQLMYLPDTLLGDGATQIVVAHNPKYAERSVRRLKMLDGLVRDERAAAT